MVGIGRGLDQLVHSLGKDYDLHFRSNRKPMQDFNLEGQHSQSGIPENCA